MYILLDIDGVMVPANSWKRPEILADGFFAFSEKATSSLNQILDYKEANVILTTSHKYRYSLEQWLNIFKARKIDIDKISRLPENKNFLNRRDEILHWLETHPNIEKYLILDDDKSLNALPKKLKEKLVLTDSAIGLNLDKAEEAILKIDKFEVEHID